MPPLDNERQLANIVVKLTAELIVIGDIYCIDVQVLNVEEALIIFDPVIVGPITIRWQLLYIVLIFVALTILNVGA